MRRRGVRKPQLDDTERALLLGEGNPFYPRRLMEPLWREHGDWALKEYVRSHPGKRPPLWWMFSAPRWQVQDMPERCRAWAVSWNLPEPRRRQGGVGTATYECLNVVPSFHVGIPTSFLDHWLVRYYNGCATDVHGNSIPFIPFGSTEPVTDGYFPYDAVDGANPPRFESQASYLKRHDLFLVGEARRLRDADFLDEVVRPRPEPKPSVPQFGGLRVVK